MRCRLGCMLCLVTSFSVYIGLFLFTWTERSETSSSSIVGPPQGIAWGFRNVYIDQEKAAKRVNEPSHDDNNNNNEASQTKRGDTDTGKHGDDKSLAADEPPPKSFDKDPFGYVTLDGRKALDLHCSQCALISASGQLLNSGSGEDIDNIPCVVRMNQAPTKGFESDVGSKTTIRFTAHSSLPSLMRDPMLMDDVIGRPQYIIFWGPPKEMDSGGSGVVYNEISALSMKYPYINFIVLTNDQYQYAEYVFREETGKDRITSGSWLTTGWFTMILLRNICDSISIYGMVSPGYCQSPTKPDVPYHYFSPNGFKECAQYREHENAKAHGHRFMSEKYVFIRWALTKYNITFHSPEIPLTNLMEFNKPKFLT
ncbi:alpha-N-acetylgalactosaminide alpha-2,6-sialyltransferase 3-like [Saccoglossus kowalevskii]|uniref:Alpha-N-acetylgalactosaminide alpha-2,6-sialyltransferase 5-like n=1 Tax=Saccoglossus kowalevskii TaxID=10224 RepID=A0ABM0GX99_SACKO|nr:PREDICTED: alpha-N-acetylgalactosaminide alpha-2,6-sialyltransferase 5-like [Saccoglossus kowalevskii]